MAQFDIDDEMDFDYTSYKEPKFKRNSSFSQKPGSRDVELRVYQVQTKHGVEFYASPTFERVAMHLRNSGDQNTIFSEMPILQLTDQEVARMKARRGAKSMGLTEGLLQLRKEFAGRAIKLDMEN